MFDIGWTELLVIGVVALIVVGPKDLPGMFRTLGRFTAKARSMAREFSRAMEDAADESGVGDLAKDLKSMTSAKSLGLDTIKDAASRFEDWDPMKGKPDAKKGPATAELAEERAVAAKKIRDAAAKKVSARRAKDAAAQKKDAKPATKNPAPKKSGKKPAQKKPAPASAKKPAAKATGSKPVPLKATPVKNAPSAKTPAAKPKAKKSTAGKTSSKKPATKRAAKGATK